MPIFGWVQSPLKMSDFEYIHSIQQGDMLLEAAIS